MSYPATLTFTKGAAITVVQPVVTGSPTSFAIDPDLPPGLTFSQTNGSISGTPTALRGAFSHRVTATSANGSGAASFTLTVNDVAPSLAYPHAAYTFYLGIPITTLQPTNQGGPITHWSLDRALPAGLDFDGNTGTLTGTPTALSATSDYVVTATNTGGPDTFTLSLGVQDGGFLDLGHVKPVNVLRYTATRVMSVDSDGRALLQDAQTGSIIAAVNSVCSPGTSCGNRADLAGSVFVVRQEQQFTVYSAQTGALLTQIASPANNAARWQLAPDGGYIVESKSSGLTVWSIDGTQWLSRSGNHSSAEIFAAAGELRIAKAPGLAQNIETVTLPAGTSTQGPVFIGAFLTWFTDGEHFLSRANNDMLVYSRAGTLRSTTGLTTSAFANVGGAGDWFWSFPSDLSLVMSAYPVTGGAPQTLFPFGISATFVAQGNAVAALYPSANRINIVDFSGASPVLTDHVLSTGNITSFAARSSTDWVYGSQSGVISSAPGSSLPARFTHGSVRSITGSASRFAIATASGEILTYGANLVAEGTIDFDASRIILSADGGTLAAGTNIQQVFNYSPGKPVRLYALPARTVITEWSTSTSPGGQPRDLRDFTMAAGGTRVGLGWGTLETVSKYSREAVQLDQAVTWSDQNIVAPFHLSPSGNIVAAPNTSPDRKADVSINFYTGGVLSGNINAYPAGWIDESRFLALRYTAIPPFPDERYDGAVVVNGAGQVLATPALPQIPGFQALDAHTIYAPSRNSIFDIDTGEAVWWTGATSTGQGAVSGDHVIFAAGPKVFALPR